MSDFDKVRIVTGVGGTKELVSLEPYVGDHDQIMGGIVACRDGGGNAVVVLRAGGDTGRGSSLRLSNRQGKARALILDGDELENEDGGIIVLEAGGDAQQPGPLGVTASIVLNASKRSLVIHGQQGGTVAELGPHGNLYLGGGDQDGDIILRNGDGKDLVRLQANEQRLQILNADGEAVATLGSNGDLFLGGGDKNGDIILRDGDGEDVIRLQADEQRLQILNADGKEVALLGPHGNLYLGGGDQDGDIILRDGEGAEAVTLGAGEKTLVIRDGSRDLVRIGGSEGDIVAKGDLRQQRTTIRSRRVEEGQELDLLPLGRDGAYQVELAASASAKDGFRASSYQSWFVFTYEHSDAFDVAGLGFGGIGNFWEVGTGPDFSAHSGKLRLTIGKLAPVDALLRKVSDATLSVRALYGSIERF